MYIHTTYKVGMEMSKNGVWDILSRKEEKEGT
jgi:hypothetical protein